MKARRRILLLVTVAALVSGCFRIGGEDVPPARGPGLLGRIAHDVRSDADAEADAGNDAAP